MSLPERAPLLVADIFCGAGGLSEGFRSAYLASGRPAYRVVYGVDKDADCMDSYRASVLREYEPEQRERRGPCRSVTGLTADEILGAAQSDHIDVLVGGPNCQAVSTAGKRDLTDQRNTMFDEYVRLIEELRPRWFVMENVPGLTHANSLPLLADILGRLEALKGYKVAGEVLLAADFGVAQYRYRLLVIGTNIGREPLFPAPTHHADEDPRHLTVSDALGDGSSSEQSEHSLPTDGITRKRIAAVPEGGDWRDIPMSLLPERYFGVRSSDQKGAYGRLAWNRPAYTITGLAGNVSSGPFIHPRAHRALALREASLLQGFPDEFVFEGSLDSCFRQVGNAVPPPLARAVAEAIAGQDAGSSEGNLGRLTAKVVRAAADGEKRLPVMTPRLSKTVATVRRHPLKPDRISSVPMESVPRDQAAADRARLEAEAKLPANTWTSRRAKAILASLDGEDVAELARSLKVSPMAMQRWVEEYRTAGIDGWRAYSTPLDDIVAGDEVLESRLRAAIALVREAKLSDEAVQGKARPDMNDRLRELISKWGKHSVKGAKLMLAAKGYQVGTVYTCDLLALLDELVTDAADDAFADDRSPAFVAV